MMATAPPSAMSKTDIITAHAKLEQLRIDMVKRSAGGKDASGRYKKHDTARKGFIDTVALPSLRFGKRVADDDWRRLFLPGDDEIASERKSPTCSGKRHRNDETSPTPARPASRQPECDSPARASSCAHTKSKSRNQHRNCLLARDNVGLAHTAARKGRAECRDPVPAAREPPA